MATVETVLSSIFNAILELDSGQHGLLASVLFGLVLIRLDVFLGDAGMTRPRHRQRNVPLPDRTR